MSLNPGSAILMALYTQKPDEARKLAEAAATLTVWEAAALGRDDALARLLDADPPLVNAYAADGNTALGLAAFFRQPSTVRLLLDRGADIGAEARNFMKVQALHAAVASQNDEAIALLLERGADPNARQQVGYTPLMGAANAGRADLVDLLIQHGADPQLKNDEGKTASDIAREKGHAVLAARLTAHQSPGPVQGSTAGI